MRALSFGELASAALGGGVSSRRRRPWRRQNKWEDINLAKKPLFSIAASFNFKDARIRLHQHTNTRERQHLYAKKGALA